MRQHECHTRVVWLLESASPRAGTCTQHLVARASCACSCVLVTIVPCAPVIAAWIQTTQDGVSRKLSVQLPAVKLAKLAPLAIAAAAGALVTMAVMRSR